MSEIINYTRLTTSDRLEGKFVTCQVHIPQDRDKAQLGTIFAQIEIESPWFSTSQVGQTIINSLVKEYYRGTDTSDLVNFEEAIKKVNESLAHVAQSGETEWIGKLSGILALLNKSEIHFSQTGKSQAYLYRSGKINHITEGLESAEAPHPLKTFSNLTSGSLQEDDKIIVANSTFFDVINPSELRLIITSLPPSLAAIECAKILQSHGCQDANAIFIELTTIDKLADLPPEQKVEAIYLDQQILTLGKLSKNAVRNIASSSKSTAKKIFSSFYKFSSEKIKPLAEKGIEKSKENSKKMVSATSKIVSQVSSKSDGESTQNTVVKKDPILEKIKIGSASGFTKIRNKIRRPLIKIGFYTEKKSKMYLALLIVVILGLGVTVYFSLNNQKNKSSLKEAESAYQQIVSISGQADVAMGNNNTVDAIDKYSAVLELQEKVSNTKYANQSKTLIDKANNRIAELTHLKSISPSASADLSSASKIALLKDELYAYSGSDLYIEKDDKSFTKSASIGSPSQLFTSIDELDLLASISNNKLISFNTQGNELKQSSVKIGRATGLSAFGSNLYILDQASKFLWKVPFKEGTFGDGTNYFKEEVDTTRINSIAIDGSLYTLGSDGVISKYSRGIKASEFNIKLPDNPKQVEFSNLIANDSVDNMLVAAKVSSQYRLVKLKKTGEIINQFKLNDINELNTLTTNSSLDKAFVSSGNKVLTFLLN